MNTAPFCARRKKEWRIYKMKKLIAMFLALAMLLTMVGSCAVAEEKIHLTGMCWGSTA